jgi:hypothetical protein
VSNTKLRNSSGFSVIGKATTGAGDPADIVAADETVLGRTGGGNSPPMRSRLPSSTRPQDSRSLPRQRPGPETTRAWRLAMKPCLAEPEAGTSPLPK